MICRGPDAKSRGIMGRANRVRNEAGGAGEGRKDGGGKTDGAASENAARDCARDRLAWEERMQGRRQTRLPDVIFWGARNKSASGLKDTAWQKGINAMNDKGFGDRPSNDDKPWRNTIIEYLV